MNYSVHNIKIGHKCSHELASKTLKSDNSFHHIYYRQNTLTPYPIQANNNLEYRKEE